MNFQELIISLLGDLNFDGAMKAINTAAYYIETKYVGDKMFLSLRIKDDKEDSLEEYKNTIITVIGDLCLTLNLLCVDKNNLKFILSK